MCKTICETVADQNRLKINVAVLVRQNLRGKYRDVMASVRLARDVEALLRVLRELLEEQCEQGVDVLASGHCVADRASRVRVTNVNRLVEEDDGRIAVPRVVIMLDLLVLCDRSRAKLHEKAC